MTYSIEYTGAKREQDGGREIISSAADPRDVVRYQPPRRWLVPSILKTSATFIVAGAVFFGAEAIAPATFKPSTLMGTYDARVQAAVQTAVKAAELSQQAKYEAWAAEVKVSVEQQAEQYKALNQTVLAHYQATFDRAKIWAEAAGRLQAQYVAARMSQTQATQSSDVSVINLTRMFGRGANWLSPGSGDGALAYANELSAQLSNELTAAATQGVTVSIEGWDVDIASVETVQREIEGLKPIIVPAPPALNPARTEN